MLPLALLLTLIASAKDQPKNVKTTAWPPKAGIKTPGIQIPMSSLVAEAELSLNGNPAGILAEGMALSIPLSAPGSVARITPRDNKLQEPWQGVSEPCGGIVQGFQNIWIPDCQKQEIVRLEARSGKRAGAVAIGIGKAFPALAASSDSVWVLSDDRGTLSRIDPETNSIVSELRLDASCNAVYSELDAVWVLCPAKNEVLKVNPRTNLVDKRIETAAQPVALSTGDSFLWVLGGKDGKISKIDPKTNKVEANIETGVPEAKGSLSFGDSFLWVSQPGYPLTKIETKTGKVVQQFAGEGGGLLRFQAGALWLVDPVAKKVFRYDPKRVAATLPE
jgi:DNA-binding beta-propeller fold protein YncE